MKFEKTDFFRSISQSHGSLSNNLRKFGYDIVFGISMIPLRIGDDDKNEIKIKWNLALGNGSTIHYWYFTIQGWRITNLSEKVDEKQLIRLIEDSYIYFRKDFLNNPEHNDAISNMIFAKRPTDVNGYYLESTLPLLEAEIYNRSL